VAPCLPMFDSSRTAELNTVCPQSWMTSAPGWPHLRRAAIGTHSIAELRTPPDCIETRASAWLGAHLVTSTRPNSLAECSSDTSAHPSVGRLPGRVPQAPWLGRNAECRASGETFLSADHEHIDTLKFWPAARLGWSKAAIVMSPLHRRTLFKLPCGPPYLSDGLTIEEGV
jgi:hypothetical protein